ncbi:MAG: NfeD family protein [Candidatus Eiseniibacteriota bacterium]
MARFRTMPVDRVACAASALRVVLAAATALVLSAVAAQAQPKAYQIDLDGPIGPVTADYVERGLAEAAAGDASVVILRIDTPGGLDQSMRAMIRAILSSPVPVVGYVAPSGARAASAGVYIMYACAIAAMAPGTNIGAATPVSLFGGGDESPSAKPDSDKADTAKPKQIRPSNAEMTKVTNDAVAYIRGLATLHGRNADWAERAVREAVSLPYDEAVKQRVVDLVAPNVEALLKAIDGHTVVVAGAQRTLAVAGATVTRIEPGWRTRLLATLTNPTVAYILLLIGIYGLIFEFSHPGIFAPGVIGAISLLLGMLALDVVPIDLAGAGLALLGIILMVAEAFVPSFGALGLGGAVAFAIGSLMAFGTPGFQLAWPVVAATTAVSAGFFLLILAMLIRSRRRRVTSGEAALLGADGRVVDWSGSEGQVQTQGEIWHARADRPLEPGETVTVVGRDGLTLTVEADKTGRKRAKHKKA